ncbi:MAG: SpoIVB peptidase [Clostridia bacterium]|nr:SpoIVB peptidase [Clostridia bacterium]
MKRVIKVIFVLCFIASIVSLSGVAYYGYNISDSYYITNDSTLELGYLAVSCEDSKTREVGGSDVKSVNGSSTTVSLFGFIPIKSVNVIKTSKTQVAVFGSPFGIKAYTKGVLVVGYSDISTEKGNVNPAKKSGILVGDIILSINGQGVLNNSDVQRVISDSNGKILDFVMMRNGKELTVSVIPEFDAKDKKYKTGLWVRDSSAGIGTLTFYCPNTNVIAGLGHGMCDADTGELLPCGSGEFVEADVVGVKKATRDVTGELQGVFSGGQIAEIVKNDVTGLYGTGCQNAEAYGIYEIGFKQEIKEGKAEVLTTVDGCGPGLYECRIERVYRNDSSKIKNMVVKITDKKLLEKTGGIVQGMSGSPIIQNGKLIGAVTHVLVDDPTKGYGIFAETMLETAQSVSEQQLKEAS